MRKIELYIKKMVTVTRIRTYIIVIDVKYYLPRSKSKTPSVLVTLTYLSRTDLFSG